MNQGAIKVLSLLMSAVGGYCAVIAFALLLLGTLIGKYLL